MHSLYTVGFQNKLGANTTVSLLSRIGLCRIRERKPAYIILKQCNATAIYGLVSRYGPCECASEKREEKAYT